MPSEFQPYLTVYTWGTVPKKASGMSDFLHRNMFGGNVGHASLELMTPVTPETTRIIEEYCKASGKEKK